MSPREPLNNTVLIVDNVALCNEKFIKQVDLRLSVLTTHTYQKAKQRMGKLFTVMDIFITMAVVMAS